MKKLVSVRGAIVIVVVLVIIPKLSHLQGQELVNKIEGGVGDALT